MFSSSLLSKAEELIRTARGQGVRIVTAESCTGGMIAALLTEISGASDVFERGFVTYSNQSKTQVLGVPVALIERDGAVSEAVAVAMVQGVLAHSSAQLSVAVTGIAGPMGGTADKPVGTVHIAVQKKGDAPVHRKFQFPVTDSRTAIRLATTEAALTMLYEQLVVMVG